MSTVKLYSIDIEKVKGKNIGLLNPTCRAMVRTLYNLAKEEDFEGIAGDDLLRECIRNKSWSTRQDDDKLHTTFAYYKKLLVTEWEVFKVGEIAEESESEILN